MAGSWASTTQLGYVINAGEFVDLKDLDENGTADSNVGEWALTSSARVLWSIIQGRDDYGSDTTMAPEAYTAGSGTYPILEAINTYLAIALLSTGQGPDHMADMSEGIYNHWTIQLARDIRNGDADVVAT